MPDQPADPIHYDMKIPPEPKHQNKESESEKTNADEAAPEPGDAPGANAMGEAEQRPGR